MDNIDRNELFCHLSIFERYANAYSPITEKAKRHLSRGINYRYILMQDSLLLLEEGIEKLPYNRYEIGKINVAINSVYINLRGITDNIAWIIYYDIIKSGLSKMKISLYDKDFLRKLEGSQLHDIIIAKYIIWFRELNELRDPIAHRLPLYLPPRVILKSSNATEAQAYIDAAEQALAQGNKEEWHKNMEKYSEIGEELPILLIDNSETMKLKPVSLKAILEKDFATLASLGKDIFSNMN